MDIEDGKIYKTFNAYVPDKALPGDKFQIKVEGRLYDVFIPEGAEEGQLIQLRVPMYYSVSQEPRTRLNRQQTFEENMNEIGRLAQAHPERVQVLRQRQEARGVYPMRSTINVLNARGSPPELQNFEERIENVELRDPIGSEGLPWEDSGIIRSQEGQSVFGDSDDEGKKEEDEKEEDKTGGKRKTKKKTKKNKNKKKKKTFAKKYLPKRLSKKDRVKQRKALLKSQKDYKKGKYYTRPKVESYDAKPSKHVVNARKIYGVDNVAPTSELARKTGCSVTGLKKIIKKGQGAYYSSGSRPNQSGHSWGVARMASAITGSKAAAVDFHILDKYCDKTKKAYKLGLKAKKKHGRGTRKVPKTT
tara:strand:- start:1917 stop:2996 length:1080 start_codon:yes stop_codon:yes gene_type:complete